MKKILMLLAVLGLMGGVATSASAGPAEDLKQFRDFFKKKFPTVKFDEFANGLYALPGFEEYRASWNTYNEFPPYEFGLANGKKLWDTPFKNGKTFASCFKNGGKNTAQHYPYWDEKSQKVRTAEMDLMDCAKKNGAEPSFLKADLNKDTKARVQLAELTGYFYSLSKGQRISIDLSKPGAVKAYEAGKKFWWGRRGQLNFACANCHVDLAGKNFGGGQPLSAGLGHTTAWPAQRLDWNRIETIHFRYMTCNKQVRAKPLKHGADAYTNLQLYETYMSSGLPLTAPAMRN
ncbi:MAG: sulfur oxidation c-type cytochrome SoxA [Candidatus Muproteobacteria bacterium RBG_16_62_13]|uniref:SoxAX cytochrome complex subunit A n=1 Tax=Candidatus Muproteobacteria bacterium RBG_16_62_13 TaxID=1817756 RepID=A0A1F6T886_9PROT|nr:MAG: sulfur oxidation c-type cytochrome SoxA [Candidatus Muproteobacteria bacterium RBG_16_62_13]